VPGSNRKDRGDGALGNPFYQNGDGESLRDRSGVPDFPGPATLDRTGHNLLHTLYEQTVGFQIPFYEEWYVLSLVVMKGDVSAFLDSIFLKGGSFLSGQRLSSLHRGYAGSISDRQMQS